MTTRAHPLRSAAGQHALQALVGVPTLYAFDFDGTLAPIVPRPSDARMSRPMFVALGQLAVRVPVAVITGRAVADMRGRVPQGVRVIGNHGNEGLAAPLVDERRAFTTCRAWLKQLSTRTFAPGVAIEDKGVSLSVHTRRALDDVRVEREVRDAIAALVPTPRVILGKRIFNVLAADAITKREALLALLHEAGCTHALFVGDDDTDEHVFRDAPPTWVTVRVESARDTAARWYVASQLDVLALLSDLEHATRALLPEQRRTR